jgi:hypothetical protein
MLATQQSLQQQSLQIPQRQFDMQDPYLNPYGRTVETIESPTATETPGTDQIENTKQKDLAPPTSEPVSFYGRAKDIVEYEVGEVKMLF